MNQVRIPRRATLAGLGGLSLATGLSLSRSWADTANTSLNFLAVGDWGRGGDMHQQDVADRMGASAKDLKASFVISVGDNFYEDGVNGIDDPQWQKSFEAIYRAPSLQVPWYVALGNHDYHGDTQAQIAYSGKSERWRMPSRWYAFDAQAPDGAAIAFFVLDTSPMIGEYYEDGAVKVKVGEQKLSVNKQLNWLEQSLATSNADWKIVIGHHPIYSGKLPGGQSPDLAPRLDPILQRHRVGLYMNGHDHDLQHVFHGMTHYVCTGAGSKMAPRCEMVGSDFCSLHPGFVACSITRNQLRVGYTDASGAELHVLDIPKAS